MGNTQYTLTPGRFTNLPSFNSGDVVIFKQASANTNGGIYYIDGGGFSFTGQGAMSGAGIMIYNAPKQSNDSVSISGQGTVGKLVNDEEAYHKVVSTLDSIRGGVDTVSSTIGALQRFRFDLDLNSYALKKDSQSNFFLDIDPQSVL